MNQLFSFDIFFPELNWKTLTPANFQEAIDVLLPTLDKEHEELLEGPLTFQGLFSPENTPNKTRLHVCGEILFLLNTSSQTPELNSVFENFLTTVLPKISELKSDSRLYHRVLSLSYSQDFTNLTDEEQSFIHHFLMQDELYDEQKKEILEINNNLITLKQKFLDNIIQHKKIISAEISEKEFDGLPMSTIEAIKKQKIVDTRNKKYQVPITSGIFADVINFCDNSIVRNNFFLQAKQIAKDLDFNNTKIAQQIVDFYQLKAQLLGYQNSSEFLIAGNLLSSTKSVKEMISKIYDFYHDEYVNDSILQENFAQAFLHSKPKNSDKSYIINKIDFAKNNLDHFDIENYFSFPKVLQGLQNLLKKTFNISFVLQKDVHLWNDDVLQFVAYDKQTHEKLGELFLDLYIRPNKKDGASCSELIPRQKLKNGKISTPIIYISCNFHKNVNQTLKFHQVKTLFHEFGHALNHFFSKNSIGIYSGTSNVPLDAVEIPSVLFEKFCYEPTVLKDISEHIITGESLPDFHLESIKNSEKSSQAAMMFEYAFIANLDFEIFSNKEKNIQTIEQEMIKKYTYNSSNIEELMQTHLLSHVFSGDYASNMYSYMLAEIISTVLYNKLDFKDISLENSNFQRFKDTIFSAGGAKDIYLQYNQLVEGIPHVENFIDHYLAMQEQ